MKWLISSLGVLVSIFIAGSVLAQPLHKPIRELLEGGLTELVGINEAAMAQNTFSDEVAVTLSPTSSGEILKLCIYATEDDAGGGGTIIAEDGTLFVFDVDPTTTVADTTLDAANFITAVATFTLSGGDYYSDANGAVNCQKTNEMFHSLGTLYFVYRQEGATTINSAAGDDEQIEFNFWYRRDL